MFKKILLASSLLALTGVAVADAIPYVGGGLGIVTNTSSSVAIGRSFNPSTGASNTISQPGNFRGVPVNIFMGLGGFINPNFYLGGEINGTLTTAEIQSNNGMKSTYGYGASIIPGLMLSDTTMAFARAGVVRTRFTSHADQTRTGGQIGLGLQTTVTQNIDLRGEYDFTAYGNYNNNVGRVASPRSDAFNLALLYKFE